MIKFFIVFFLSIRLISAQGSVLLVGGGSENYNDWSDVPYGWLVNKAPNKKILIVHYSTVSTFLPDYFKSLGASQAVSVILNASTANDSSTYKMIMEYDGIFLRGGDQWEYVKQWKGSLTEQAINKVFQRGGVIGGTSAGAMVLSRIIADAKTTSVDPRTSIRSPLSSGITFTEDFLGFVPDLLCDTHFYERGRLGRLLAMLSVYHQQHARWITGVGIDDATALGISSDSSAEVFGSGVVSLLLPDEQTTSSVRSAKPLGVSAMKLLQFTKGTVFHVQSGKLIAAPQLLPFSPVRFSTKQNVIMLDGGTSSAEWISSSGSVAKFLSRISNDTICVLTTAPSNVQTTALRDHLSSLNFPSTVLTVSPILRNSPGQESIFNRYSSFVIMNVHSDSLSFFLDTVSLTGSAFRMILGKNVILLGDASALAGSSFVNKLEITTTAAYRGRLTVERGLSLLNGMIILPRLYESDSYVENRASGLPWGIGKSQPTYGMYLDNSSHCVFENGMLRTFGLSPVILFDLQSTTATAFPSYIASGGIGPRQNAAFDRAAISVLPDSNVFVFDKPAGIISKGDNISPREHQLLNTYPNPFNPSTTIEFIVAQSAVVTITVSDILGRVIEIPVSKEYAVGKHRVEFNGSRFPSGIYYMTMLVDGMRETRKAVLLK